MLLVRSGSFLFTQAVVLAALACACSTSSDDADPGAPSGGLGGPGGSGGSNGAGQTQFWNVEVVPKNQQDGTETNIRAAVADANGVYAMTLGGDVFGLDATTGKSLFAARVARSRAGIALADGKLLLVADDGELAAVDATRGTIAWTHHYGHYNPFELHAAIVDGVLAWWSADGLPIGVRIADGSLAWTASVTAKLGIGNGLFSEPATDGKSFFFAADDRTTASAEPILLAIDPATGKQKWRAPRTKDSTQDLFATNDVVIQWVNTPSSASLFDVEAYDVATGSKRWTVRSLEIARESRPVAIGATIGFAGKNSIRALRAADGTTAFEAAPPTTDPRFNPAYAMTSCGPTTSCVIDAGTSTSSSLYLVDDHGTASEKARPAEVPKLPIAVAAAGEAIYVAGWYSIARYRGPLL